MPIEEIAGTPTPEVDESWINLAEIRAEREKDKEPPATPPVEEVKTAPVTEAGKPEEEEEVEGTDKDGKPAKVKVKGGFQRKIDKLTKEKSDLERTVADLQTRQAALETAKPEVKVEAKAEGDPEPKEEDFKDYKEYAKSLSRWVTRQELKADREQSAKASQQEAETKTKAAAKEKFDKFVGDLQALKTSKPDAAQAFSEMQIPNYIHHRLIGMTNGADVAYQLAKNKEVMGRIAELNQEALARGDGDFSDAYDEFAVFVRSLKTSSSPAPKIEKPVSQAPKPITPVGGGAGPTEADPDSMSAAEYRRARESGRLR